VVALVTQFPGLGFAEFVDVFSAWMVGGACMRAFPRMMF